MSPTPPYRMEIDVVGVPETQGSARAFVRGGRAVVTSANQKLRPWRDLVTAAAVEAKPEWWIPIDGPAVVEIEFFLPRPQTAPKTKDVLPFRGKDVDKLVRSILDSLTNAAVIVDDSRVVRLVASKRYAVGPHLAKIYTPGYDRAEPGCRIAVRTL